MNVFQSLGKNWNSKRRKEIEVDKKGKVENKKKENPPMKISGIGYGK